MGELLGLTAKRIAVVMLVFSPFKLIERRLFSSSCTPRFISRVSAHYMIVVISITIYFIIFSTHYVQIG
jgi:hypothetical protein